MEHQPSDILSLLGTLLTLKDILAVATTNKELENKLQSPVFNRDLAVHFGFPFGLSLVELKKYEGMSLNQRLIIASGIGDMRVINRLLELGANDYEGAMASAAKGGQRGIMEQMIEFGAKDYERALGQAALGGHMDIVEWMYKVIIDCMLDELYDGTNGKAVISIILQRQISLCTLAIASAAKGGHKEIVEKMTELSYQ
jgi:hypothetical protein